MTRTKYLTAFVRDTNSCTQSIASNPALIGSLGMLLCLCRRFSTRRLNINVSYLLNLKPLGSWYYLGNEMKITSRKCNSATWYRTKRT